MLREVTAENPIPKWAASLGARVRSGGSSSPMHKSRALVQVTGLLGSDVVVNDLSS